MIASDKPGRAVIYARVSTMRQAEADLSLPDQIRQLRDYCARKQLTVVDVFTEPGASALDEDRPIFQEMIRRATSSGRPYDLVVVHSLSRFSRDTMHSEVYVRKLAKAGVRLVSITQELGQDGHGDLIRKIVNAFDEHQSRENAKHTHRAMMENARQGFWNGSTPPFGYAIKIKERRGNKDKKVLVINEVEASVVRTIFDLCLGTDGRPLGVKAIANYFNDRGVTRRGRRFSTGSLHDLLTSSTYCGRHHFNRTNSRTLEKRPPSQWVELAVPPIVDEETYNRAQAMLHSRAPKVMAPRNVNGPTMLASVARCGGCGSAMILNTGKGGAYRYYSCSRAMKQGKIACPGRRIRMDHLDDMVLGHLSEQLFAPDRLADLLQGYMAQAKESRASQHEKLRQARDAAGRADASVSRLLALVESGVMEPDAPELRERLVALRSQKSELGRDISRLQNNLHTGEPELSAQKLKILSMEMRKRLAEGPPQLRQAYMRLLLENVTVDHDSIRLEGSPVILEKLASRGLPKSSPEVLSFVREWRPREDSNLRPPV